LTDGADRVFRSVAAVFQELAFGSASDAAWVLNPGDDGLLRSLDKLSATAASARASDGGPSIAAHVDHLRYGLELLNRWSRGENPFADANYSASWRRTSVSDEEWATLRARLRDEATAWLDALRKVREVSDIADVELVGLIASVAHLAYHLGAIRQLDRSTRGPSARD
jgi:hypothetical protein